MKEYIVITEDQDIFKQKFGEEEIQHIIEYGWAVLRLNNGKIEYADIDHKTGTVLWKEPKLK